MSDLADIVFSDMPDEKVPFAIDTIDKANWATRKIAKAERDIRERELVANEYKAKIDKWLAAANKNDLDTVENMTRLLEPYAEAALKDRREKYVDLFYARVGFRKTPERIEVEDEAAAIAYCEANEPEAVKVEKRILKSKLKDAAKTPGVSVTAGENRFYITVNAAELEALEK